MTIYQSDKEERIVFHFNKGHLADPKVPMWTLKVGGQSLYANHVQSDIGFRTKETPDNPVTKGSIQFHGILTLTQHGDSTEALISRLAPGL